MDKEKTRVLDVLVKPVNNREPDTAAFVYEKIKSIINSCRTKQQLRPCHNLVFLYRDRFPDHSGFFNRLFDGLFTKLQTMQ